MKVSFQPTQLGVAVQAPVLRRIVEELTPRGMLGEVAILQTFRDDPMVLVLKSSRRGEVKVTFDREMLYSPAREGDLRECVSELFQRFSQREG